MKTELKDFLQTFAAEGKVGSNNGSGGGALHLRGGSLVVSQGVWLGLTLTTDCGSLVAGRDL